MNKTYYFLASVVLLVFGVTALSVYAKSDEKAQPVLAKKAKKQNYKLVDDHYFQQMQSETYLQDSKNPNFLKTNKNRQPASLNSKSVNVEVMGLCTNQYGLRYSSFDKNYRDCLSDPTARQSGSTMNSYFGPAQSQAGVGFLLFSK